MSKYHELTNKIIDHYEERKCLGYSITDRIVRGWLAETSIKIFKNYDNGFVDGLPTVRKILGLTEKEEVVVEKKWCEHLEMSKDYLIYKTENRPFPNKFVGLDINFCPICGTPRTSEPSKRERASAALKRTYQKWTNSERDSLNSDYFDALADAVIEEMDK